MWRARVSAASVLLLGLPFFSLKAAGEVDKGNWGAYNSQQRSTSRGPSSTVTTTATSTSVTRSAGYTSVTFPGDATLISSLPMTISAAADLPLPTTSPGRAAADATVTYGEKQQGQTQPKTAYDLPPLPPPEPTPAGGSYALPAVYAHPTAVQQPTAAAAAGKQQQQHQQQLEPAATAPANRSRPATTLSVVTVTTSQPVTLKISPAKKPGLAPLTEVSVAGHTRTITAGSEENQGSSSSSSSGGDGQAATAAQPSTPAGSTSSSSSSSTSGLAPGVIPTPPPAPPAASTSGSSSSSSTNSTTWVFTQPGSNSTVKIGCALPFEGSQKLMGQAILVGLKMAITDFAPKALPGVDVNLTCIDSKCRDIPAFNAMSRLADDKAVGVIGEVCSGASVAAAGVAASRRVPLISAASTSPSLSRQDYFLRTVPSDRYQGVAAANLVYRNGSRNVGLVYEDAAYGYGLAFNFIAGFTNAGGSVPSVYMFKPDKGNATAAVAKMLEGKASQKSPVDAVFIATTDLNFVADFLKAAAAAQLDLPLYGGDALADVTLSNSVINTPAAALLPRLTVTAPNPGQEGFVKLFNAFDGGKTPFSGFAATAYDAMVAMLQALGTAGVPYKGEAVLQHLLKQKNEGVSGPIQFDANGDLQPSSTAYAYLRFTPNGTLQLQGLIEQTLRSGSSSGSGSGSSATGRRALRSVRRNSRRSRLWHHVS